MTKRNLDAPDSPVLTAKDQQTDTKWRQDEVPTDRFVQRWHRVWNCPITVRHMTEEEKQTLSVVSEEEWWMEATRSNTWPERSFTQHWAEAEPAPAGVANDLDTRLGASNDRS